jgi:hypothetical protein
MGRDDRGLVYLAKDFGGASPRPRLCGRAGEPRERTTQMTRLAPRMGLGFALALLLLSSSSFGLPPPHP